MHDILLHSSKVHRDAKRFRKNFKPIPSTVSQGVQVAISLLTQLKNNKLTDASKR